MKKHLKYGLLSFLLLLLFITFVYTNPIKYFLYSWLHTRSFVPVIAVPLFAISAYFSIKCLNYVLSKKEDILLGIILSSFVWIYLVWLICWVIFRNLG